MDQPAQQSSPARMFGTMSLVAGLGTSLITAFSDYQGLEPQIVAFFLILTGIGLRIEAAITDRRL